MKKIIKGLFRAVLVITLIAAMSIPVFASDIDDPIGRCRIAPSVEIHKL